MTRKRKEETEEEMIQRLNEKDGSKEPKRFFPGQYRRNTMFDGDKSE